MSYDVTSLCLGSLIVISQQYRTNRASLPATMLGKYQGSWVAFCLCQDKTLLGPVPDTAKHGEKFLPITKPDFERKATPTDTARHR
jgi:hypothetical protein